MIIILSPAKSLDFESKPITQSHTQPALLKDSSELIKQLKQYSPSDLSNLMHISDKLGVLNYTRYQEWKRPFTKNNAKQSILAFKGDVYQGLEADTFDEADLEYAQNHLRILSGLYGVLRPLDLMQPYRLEMGTALANKKGDDLYAFWGEKITKEINNDLKKSKSEYLVNLASNEYFRSIQADDINAEVITPVFKDFKNGKYKIISFFAKKARGMMSRFIIKNKITDVQQLKTFKMDGYKFYKSQSTANEWVFQRKQG